MTPTGFEYAKAGIEALVALGTVGALIAAIATLRIQSHERRRAEVSRVRASLDWDALDPPKKNFGNPRFVIDNGSDDSIYDVNAQSRPNSYFKGSLGLRRGDIGPGEVVSTAFGMATRVPFGLGVRGGDPWLEFVFTDARGARWCRDRYGRLMLVKPLTPFAFWRVPHELDTDDLPRWAWRARWRRRWVTQHNRHSNHYPPEWWAVDVRWSRWRWARTHDPICIPWWNLKKKHLQRHAIARRRAEQSLPMPWWAVDDRWQQWRWTRQVMAADRKRWNAEMNSGGEAHV